LLVVKAPAVTAGTCEKTNPKSNRPAYRMPACTAAAEKPFTCMKHPVFY
jgi:hypothetical protein